LSGVFADGDEAKASLLRLILRADFAKVSGQIGEEDRQHRARPVLRHRWEEVWLNVATYSMVVCSRFDGRPC